MTVDDKTFAGKTDSNGCLEYDIPANTCSGHLQLSDGIYPLAIGGLDPISETSGVEQRMKNLGYFWETEGNTLTDATKEALERFQKDNQLQLTKAEPH